MFISNSIFREIGNHFELMNLLGFHFLCFGGHIPYTSYIAVAYSLSYYVYSLTSTIRIAFGLRFPVFNDTLTGSMKSFYCRDLDSQSWTSLNRNMNDLMIQVCKCHSFCVHCFMYASFLYSSPSDLLADHNSLHSTTIYPFYHISLR